MQKFNTMSRPSFKREVWLVPVLMLVRSQSVMLDCKKKPKQNVTNTQNCILYCEIKCEVYKLCRRYFPPEFAYKQLQENIAVVIKILVPQYGRTKRSAAEMKQYLKLDSKSLVYCVWLPDGFFFSFVDFFGTIFLLG